MPASLRRPMSAALKTPELNSEALAFIQEGIPKSRLTQVAVEPVKAKTEMVLVPEDPTAEPVEEPRNPTRINTAFPKNDTFVATPGLAFTSLRLPAEIAHALLRASFDRKLKREKPSTQQDIAAEALSLWLERKGYL